MQQSQEPGPNNERNRARQKRRTELNREYVRELKARSECADCGAKEDLTFDHLPGFVKVDNVSNLVTTASPTKLKREIAKCRIVCLPCHRRREKFRGIANHRVKGNIMIMSEEDRLRELAHARGMVASWQATVEVLEDPQVIADLNESERELGDPASWIEVQRPE